MSNKDINPNGGGWLVILLKVVAYAVGLILAGVGTTASAQMLGII